MRELLEADRLAEIEVPLAELDIDVNGDGKSEKIEKRWLGATPVLSLVAEYDDGRVGSVGVCYGCASATTRDIKALEIEGKLYILSFQPSWSFLARLNFGQYYSGRPQNEICHFGDSPLLRAR